MAPISEKTKELAGRLALGALIGMGLASGKVPGAGSAFLMRFLQPLSKNERAIEFIARRMVEATEDDEEWDDLSRDQQELFKDRARAALEGVTYLAARTVAGERKKTKTQK